MRAIGACGPGAHSPPSGRRSFFPLLQAVSRVVHTHQTPAAVSAFWDDHFPQIQKARDITIVSISPGGAVLRLVPQERHLRPGGTVSGPTLVTLADVTAYAALLAHVGPEPLIVTTNLNINFMRKSPLAPLTAICRILKLGRRLAVADVEIRPEAGGEMIAHVTATYSIPPKR